MKNIGNIMLGINTVKNFPSAVKAIYNAIPFKDRIIVHYEFIENVSPCDDLYHCKTKDGIYKICSSSMHLKFFYHIFKDKYDIDTFTGRKDLFQSVVPTTLVTIPDTGVYYRILDRKTCVVCIVTMETMDLQSSNEWANGKVLGTYSIYRFKLYFIGANANYYYKKYARKSYNSDERTRPRYLKMNHLIKVHSFTKMHRVYTEYVIAKPIENIFMDSKKKNDLMDKVNRFLRSKDIYKKNNIPYRLGVLLHGCPGTGKTSFAYALAYELGCDVMQINADTIAEFVESGERFDDYMVPTEVTDYSSASERTVKSIYLIDEIDTLTDDNKKYILRKDHIFNFIDRAPEGTIIIGTTNSLESIDPATIRPGRFDIHVEMNEFDKDLALQMIRSYGLDDSFADKFTYPIMPSELQFHITQELYSKIQ